MPFCVWFGCEDYGLDGCVNGGEYGGEDSSEVVGVDGGCVGLGVCIDHGGFVGCDGCVGVDVVVCKVGRVEVRIVARMLVGMWDCLILSCFG